MTENITPLAGQSYDTLDVQSDGYVTSVYLNRPDTLNSFNETMRAELLDALKKIGDSDVRIVVLGGRGRAFCSGEDLNEGVSRYASFEEKVRLGYAPILEQMAAIPQSIIGSAQGAIAGIGCGIALNCDLLVMSEASFFLQAFSNIGLIPDGGCHWHLAHNIGYKRAFELMVEGDRLTSDQCLTFGIANKVVDESELESVATAWANKLSGRAPLSLRNTKKVLRQALDHNMTEVMDMEAVYQGQNFESEDGKEGIAAFKEKRKPNFTGK